MTLNTTFTDASGRIRLEGSLGAPGATVGDVLTVQADGSVAPAAGGGSQPGAIVGTKASFIFSDFADQGSNLGRTPLAFTLEPGAQLLFATMRITESFDDSGQPNIYVSSAAAGEFGGIVGNPAGFGPNANTASDGLVGLFAAAYGTDWSAVNDPSEVETDALDLYVFGLSMNFDGAAGAVEVTFYTCTPVAA